jgi:hypothetical protein
VTDHRPVDHSDEVKSRAHRRRLFQFILAVVSLLVLLVAFISFRVVVDWRNGCQDRLLRRANSVNAASILHRPIPAEASLPLEDLRVQDRLAPYSNGAKVLIQRAQSPAAATQIYDDLCQNGWTFEQANHYDRSDFTNGGQSEHRFCASQVIQNRFYLGYVPACGSSRDYVSYVIVQRGDALFAAYERTSRWADTGQYSNEALAEAMVRLTQESN